MLMLSRHPQEEIVLDIPGFDPVVIRVAKILAEPGCLRKVRIGIDADQRIAIHRREVWERMQEEQQAAAATE